MNPFYSLLTKSAQSEGFKLFGGVDLDLVPEELWRNHLQHFDQWLEKSFDGEMAYLKRGRDRRADPKQVFPEAKSIFCVAENYLKAESPASPESGPRYARYLDDEDYHLWFPRRLEKMMEQVALAWRSETGRELKWKVCVDTSAVLERSWAALTGLGWIGKNTLLIHPRQGSFLFLGEVLINEETGQAPKLLPDYCGHCTRCIEACPTGAIQSPGWLDARGCISYLTLEKRGELRVSETIKKQMGSWVAGCDVCMDVCPFNQKPLRSQEVMKTAADPPISWSALLNETEEAYKKRVSESALKRVKWVDFRRNLENAHSNSQNSL